MSSPGNSKLGYPRLQHADVTLQLTMDGGVELPSIVRPSKRYSYSFDHEKKIQKALIRRKKKLEARLKADKQEREQKRQEGKKQEDKGPAKVVETRVSPVTSTVLAPVVSNDPSSGPAGPVVVEPIRMAASDIDSKAIMVEVKVLPQTAEAVPLGTPVPQTAKVVSLVTPVLQTAKAVPLATSVVPTPVLAGPSSVRSVQPIVAHVDQAASPVPAHLRTKGYVAQARSLQICGTAAVKDDLEELKGLGASQRKMVHTFMNIVHCTDPAKARALLVTFKWNISVGQGSGCRI